MINLLPPEEKQRLFVQKKEKLAIVLGIVMLVFLVCLILFLLAIKFYLLSQNDYQNNVLAQNEQKIQASDSSNLSSTVKRYNIILSQLDLFYKKEVYFSQVLKNITEVPGPKGVYLTKFSLARGENGAVKVIVSGVSSTRNDLLLFKSNIEADKKIKNPYFAPESWVSPKDADFSLTFTVDQNEK